MTDIRNDDAYGPVGGDPAGTGVADSTTGELKPTQDEALLTHLRAEHFPGDVLGIGESRPRLSWVYSQPPKEGSQVLISLTRRVPGHRPVKESTFVPTEQSNLLPWQFMPLVSREQAELTVQLVSVDHRALSPKSEMLHIEAGLLLPHERLARFVGPSWTEAETDHRHLPLVRSEFQLDDEPVGARLYLTALGLVEAEINGRRVGNDALTPGWTVYDKRLECWTYDIGDELHRGDNAIGCWLGDGWYRGRVGFDGGRVNFYGDRLGVFAQIEVEFADGTTQTIYSNPWDGKWKAALGPIVSSDLYEGEHYDARQEIAAWSSPGFDDRQWSAVAESFYDPQLIENHALSAVQSQEVTAPAAITTMAQGPDAEGSCWMVDFGQNATQRMRLHMHGLAAGDRVIIRHAEVLNADGTLATKILRRGQQCDTFVSNGEDAWWEPRFAMHGFRYVTIEGWHGELRAEDIECRVYHSTMERSGWFESSNPLLNKLHSNVLWSMRSNFVSIPQDCPQRDERMGWTGDIDLFAPTAAYLYDAQGFLSSWLKDVRFEQQAWGTVPFYVPFVPLGVWAKPEAIAIWGDAAVAVPWALYMAGGDERVLSESYPLVSAWIDEVAAYISPDGVWDRKPDYLLGQLGDWLDPSAPPEDPTQAVTEKELVSTAFYARSCEYAARIAHILGHDDDAKSFTGLFERVRRGFLNRFTRLDGTMTSDTQCAYALGIAFGLFEGEAVRRTKAGNRLAELVREAGGKVDTGFAGTPYVLPALSMTGHTAEAYELLLSTKCPSWLYQVSMGGTTTWERWDSMKADGTLNDGGMTSFNHYALGSVIDWVHSHVGGLSPLEPGWSRFLIDPQPGGGIDHAATSHLTPYGEASVRWECREGLMTLDFSVPVGTTAVVAIPNSDRREFGPGAHHMQYQR